MRKQLDPRIPILINNNVAKNNRSFIVLVGDKGRDQVGSQFAPHFCSERPSDREPSFLALTSSSFCSAVRAMVL